MPLSPASGHAPHREGPLTFAALLLLAAYSVRVLATSLPGWAKDLLHAAMALAWAVALLDLAVRWRDSRLGVAYPRHHPLSVVVALLPLLRPLQFVPIYEGVRRRRRRPALSVPARVIVYTGLAVVLIGFTAALTVYWVERSAPGASIRSFGTAVWWACATLATVGYGDAVPVTPGGRVVAVALMACGVALLGAVTGAFSTYLLRVFDDERGPRDEGNGDGRGPSRE
ncbi:potassium channel family protein [Streptomyces sp. AM 3-1-1]|uniref:potassium channel family protein n=1 Tax=Streptomyces sp. AM 3-1-1 TaxID=3028711 RepID=UPI0023B96A1C|nr:potassium channel family protein [Streptomyces sp. AM 3-1-1]WEH26440.1 potassium channel family protein [Streptomyces sp. AM 3-1-1]